MWLTLCKLRLTSDYLVFPPLKYDNMRQRGEKRPNFNVIEGFFNHPLFVLICKGYGFPIVKKIPAKVFEFGENETNI